TESTLDRTVRPEWLAIYLEEQDTGAFLRAHCSDQEPIPNQLVLGRALAERVGHDRKPIFRDSLREAGTDILAEMSPFGSEVVVPLATEGRVIGLLVVGPKRSGDPYFSD